MQFYFTDLLKNELINSEDFLEICLLLISHWHLYEIVVGIEDTCVLRMLHTFNILWLFPGKKAFVHKTSQDEQFWTVPLFLQSGMWVTFWEVYFTHYSKLPAVNSLVMAWPNQALYFVLNYNLDLLKTC